MIDRSAARLFITAIPPPSLARFPWKITSSTAASLPSERHIPPPWPSSSERLSLTVSPESITEAPLVA